MEELLRKIPGVLETRVGYSGGTTDKATYEQVKTGRTGHAQFAANRPLTWINHPMSPHASLAPYCLRNPEHGIPSLFQYAIQPYHDHGARLKLFFQEKPLIRQGYAVCLALCA